MPRRASNTSTARLAGSATHTRPCPFPVQSFVQQNKTTHHSSPGYTGVLPGVPRLGIPPLRMNDGPEGFRGPAGTSTQWPSGLTVAHTFDVDSFAEYGVALGVEFSGKGANCQFGPGLNLARIPSGGRSFEYLSGEDPFLGATLVKPIVKGIQSQGVIANAKHFIANSQEGMQPGAEGDRHTSSMVVDERTMMEMYFPTFEGAVEAGVLSFMCANNLVNGIYACENNATQNGLLRARAGFRGWIASDYDGTRSTIDAANHGLDIAMPGPPLRPDYFGAPLRAAVRAGTVSEATVTQKAERVVYSLAAVGALDWTNRNTSATDVTSPAHRALARKLATASATLLTNVERMLPLDLAALKRGGRGSVAVIGGAADGVGAIYGGSGSGKVLAKDPVSVLAALYERLGQTPPGDSGGQAGSGPIVYSDGADVDAAVEAARGADVAIVVIAQTSSEGKDRPSLALNQSEIVAPIAAAQPNTVVVAVSPGPFLTPWRDAVRAILDVGLPGEQEGAAVADILFGDANPAGKLPHTLPNVENEMGMTGRQYPGTPPGTDGQIENCSSTPTPPTADGHNQQGGTGANPCSPWVAHYDEKLEVGYRWYNAHNVTPAFSFGHGLSYTSFKYGSVEVDGRDGVDGHVNVRFEVTNSGPVAGCEVAQLFVTFPASAGEPPKQLKGFAKTPLLSAHGGKTTVTLPLNDRSFSIWDVERHAWAKVKGEFELHVGSSSSDIRRSVKLNVG